MDPTMLPLCLLCDIESENIDHLFFECTVASYVGKKGITLERNPPTRYELGWRNSLV